MNIQPVNAAYGNTYGAKKPQNRSVPAHNDIKKEKVEISHQASEIQTVKTVLNQISDIRLEVVKKIKARIKNNDYPIENNLSAILKEMIQGHILKPY